ncbi:titin-like [Hexamita inflata]|uniref:Titin-like n=1 Tax=Hexamita inflata TaxID=28002 RepID=A0AA86NL17_9EUKA|nr:titin-like [Hexamita inflata]
MLPDLRAKSNTSSKTHLPQYDQKQEAQLQITPSGHITVNDRYRTFMALSKVTQKQMSFQRPKSYNQNMSLTRSGMQEQMQTDEEKERRRQLRIETEKLINQQNQERIEREKELQRQHEQQELEKQQQIAEMTRKRREELVKQQKQAQIEKMMQQQKEKELKEQADKEYELKRLQKLKEMKELAEQKKAEELERKQRLIEEEKQKQIREQQQQQAELEQRLKMFKVRELEAEAEKQAKLAEYEKQRIERQAKVEQEEAERIAKEKAIEEERLKTQEHLEQERLKHMREYEAQQERLLQIAIAYKQVDAQRLEYNEKIQQVQIARELERLEKEKREIELEMEQEKIRQEEHEKMLQRMQQQREQEEREKIEFQERIILQTTENKGFVQMFSEIVEIKDQINRANIDYQQNIEKVDRYKRCSAVHFADIVTTLPQKQISSISDFETLIFELKQWVNKIDQKIRDTQYYQKNLMNVNMAPLELTVSLVKKLKAIVWLASCVGDLNYFTANFSSLLDCTYLIVSAISDKQILARVQQQIKKECQQSIKMLQQLFKEEKKKKNDTKDIQKMIAVNQAYQNDSVQANDIICLELIVQKFEQQLNEKK